MAENSMGILEGFKMATEEVQEVSKMNDWQRDKYLEKVAKQFFELQQTVRRLIGEEDIIRNNFEWQWIKDEEFYYRRTGWKVSERGLLPRGSIITSKITEEFVKEKAEEFARKYGFTEEKIIDMFRSRNDGSARCYSYWDECYRCYYMLVPKKY